MATGMKTFAMLFLLGALPGMAVWAAADLNDPTRPAFEMVPGLDGQAADSKVVAPAGLQSVIISDRREAAIINGVEVEVGKKYGNATLVVVNETCVVLTGPEGRQVMHLYPSVNLSKTEQACAGRRGLPTLRKTVAKRQPQTKPAKVKKKVVTCADQDTEDGSGK